jgi:hypothetical protein
MNLPQKAKDLQRGRSHYAHVIHRDSGPIKAIQPVNEQKSEKAHAFEASGLRQAALRAGKVAKETDAPTLRVEQKNRKEAMDLVTHAALGRWDQYRSAF